tara:strand:- start:130 stop:453 length:324 start_codon:yes stop_codon:yes gene_type:complete
MGNDLSVLSEQTKQDAKKPKYFFVTLDEIIGEVTRESFFLMSSDICPDEEIEAILAKWYGDDTIENFGSFLMSDGSAGIKKYSHVVITYREFVIMEQYFSVIQEATL